MCVLCLVEGGEGRGGEGELRKKKIEEKLVSELMDTIDDIYIYRYRQAYGSFNRQFPASNKSEANDGTDMCSSLCHWYLLKVIESLNWSQFFNQFYIDHFLLFHKRTVWVSQKILMLIFIKLTAFNKGLFRSDKSVL